MKISERSCYTVLKDLSNLGIKNFVTHIHFKKKNCLILLQNHRQQETLPVQQEIRSMLLEVLKTLLDDVPRQVCLKILYFNATYMLF